MIPPSMELRPTRSMSMSGRLRVWVSAIIGVTVAVLTGCQPRERAGEAEVRSAAPPDAPAVVQAVEIPEIPTPVEGGTIRVVCWNIEWFPGKSLRGLSPERQSLHVKQIHEALTVLQPDILLAQEIRSEEPLL